MSCSNCGKDIRSIIAAGAVGIAKSLIRMDRAPQAVIDHRRDLCRTCEHATKHPIKKTPSGLPLISFCRVCHCSLRFKTTNADQSCPKGLWPAHATTPVT